MKKKPLALTTAVVAAVICAVGIGAGETADSGTWGSNAAWVLEDGILTVSGTGALDSAFSGLHYPWGDYIDQITGIVVMPGITYIPSYTFEYCEQVTTIRLPETLETLWLNAFNDCGSLNHLMLPSSLTSVCGTGNSGNPSFIRCEALTDVYYMGTADEWEALTDQNRVTSADSQMELHFLQLHKTPATCTSPGTKPYYRFDDTSVYGMFYNMEKQPIAQPEPLPALGHSYTADTCTDAVHPHIIYNLCACGAKQDSGKTVTVSDCGICYPETSIPETDVPEINTPTPAVTFTLASAAARPGETIDLSLTVSGQQVINSIALHQLIYDPAVLTFVGFTNTEAMEEKCILSSFDSENTRTITLALETDEALIGEICALRFTVNEAAVDGTTEVKMSSLVKHNATEIVSAMENATVTVRTYTLGDITMDEEIDIRDALLLFQHSMLPATFPITYPGNIDFTNDGSIDIRDALVLFRHSMMPNIYPLA